MSRYKSFDRKWETFEQNIEINEKNVCNLRIRSGFELAYRCLVIFGVLRFFRRHFSLFVWASASRKITETNSVCHVGV